MSWMEKLCEAYDAGITCGQTRESVRLVPLGFVQKKVKYHVVLTRDGRFISADALSEESQAQEIPSTPQAEGRTGDNGAPFPLTEQMKYLVFEEKNSRRFRRYMEQLHAWCARTDAPVCLHAVYTYLSGHTLLADLERQPNLKLKYYKNVEKREGSGEDAKAMVCFSVQMQDESTDDLWLREDVRQSWERFLTDNLPGDSAFCYVEGRMLPAMENHPKLQGNAKLVSAKDSEFPFQYKGRFAEDRSAASLSVSASLRAHNALSWLIQRQGMQKYGMTWVVWNTNGADMTVPIDEKDGFPEEEEEEDTGAPVDTFETYAREVRAAARGYSGRLHDYNERRTNSAAILGMTAATDGRMSVVYYQECSGNEYVRRLEAWYTDCCWWRYSRENKPKEIASPKPKQLAAAVMGPDAVNMAETDKSCERSDTKRMRELYSEILVCIADRQALPVDLIRSAFHRACVPLSFSGGKDRKWSRTAWETSVDTACAMLSCFQRRRKGKTCDIFPPELQTKSKNRAYLYGRLFAVADFVEEKSAEEERNAPTGAIRLMGRYVQDPFETWAKLHEKLIPCFQRLGPDSGRYQRLLSEIEGQFSEEDRHARGELSPEFLQALSSQRQRLFQKWNGMKKEGDEEPAVYKLSEYRAELYGNLLAIADIAEQEAGEGERAGKSNAMQTMHVFAARPYEAWGRLHEKLQPYLEKMGKRADAYQRMIGLVELQFSPADREETAALDASFLHGYYEMRRALCQGARLSGGFQDREERRDKRSALYGRLLGIAERIERRFFRREKENSEWRTTNALRFMTVFARKPASTWEELRIRLKPYLRHAGPHSREDLCSLEQLEGQIRENGWNVDAPLGSIYLHEYYRERNK